MTEQEQFASMSMQELLTYLDTSNKRLFSTNACLVPTQAVDSDPAQHLQDNDETPHLQAVDTFEMLPWSIDDIQSIDDLTVLENYQPTEMSTKNCSAQLKIFLRLVEITNGNRNKVYIARHMFRMLSENPEYVTFDTKFYNVVKAKLDEFESTKYGCDISTEFAWMKKFPFPPKNQCSYCGVTARCMVLNGEYYCYNHQSAKQPDSFNILPWVYGETPSIDDLQVLENYHPTELNRCTFITQSNVFFYIIAITQGSQNKVYVARHLFRMLAKNLDTVKSVPLLYDAIKSKLDEFELHPIGCELSKEFSWMKDN